MKLLLTLFFIFLYLAQPFAQIAEGPINTIDVQGYSKLPINPDNYTAQLFIQEEEQKVGYTTIGKLSIDSIKLTLFSNLKRFGIEEKDVKVMGISSRELGQYPNFLINISYEVKLKNKEIAGRLVNEMKFIGLRGIIIKRVFTKAQKDAIADSLYEDAVKDAKRVASELANKQNKTVGEIKSIQLVNNSVTSFGMDGELNTDNYTTYAYSRFEMDYRDKYATCYIRVIFELK